MKIYQSGGRTEERNATTCGNRRRERVGGGKDNE